HAYDLACLAQHELSQGNITDIAHALPVYLRDDVAKASALT
ncbi:MAG: tRNA (adenosine(37)-N6)-threonylcarbamoyltransferase complex dimerization subunit type 1 TsaB, partial [Gammaproteobacteria bacterium]